MAHNRKIALGGVSLTRARLNRHDGAVGQEVMDEVERLMVASGFLVDAPFKWIGLILRYGLKNEEAPHYGRIDRRDGELPLAIELDTHEIQKASREELKRLFMLATLKAVIHAGRRYGLPTKALEDRREQIFSVSRADRAESGQAAGV